MADLKCSCGRISMSGPVTALRCSNDDEWVYTAERVTPEQVAAMDDLLSLPVPPSFEIDHDEPAPSPPPEAEEESDAN